MDSSKHMSSWLVIRADASVTMGTGHVMRCLALAQTWQDQGGSVAFAVAELPPALESRLQQEMMQVLRLPVEGGSEADAIATATVAKNLSAQWVIVDGYQFGADYQRSLKSQGVSVLVFDDYGHADFYAADLVLNQNISAQAEWYEKRSPRTHLLLGTQYALLRREFRSWQTWNRVIPPLASKILIVLGGSDPDNITAQVLTALCDVRKPLVLDVVIGGSNPHYETLIRLAEQIPHTLNLHRNIQNMPDRMAAADVAISAAGSTCWELAYMQLPTIVLILAENQTGVATSLGKLGSVVNLGWHHQLSSETMASALSTLQGDAEKRSKLAQLGRGLVDGRGTMRVLEAMVQVTDQTY